LEIAVGAFVNVIVPLSPPTNARGQRCRRVHQPVAVDDGVLASAPGPMSCSSIETVTDVT
jgi:hypothetical protein